MATAGSIIENALRKLGVIASGEDPSSAEQADGLTALNQLLESVSNENMLIFDDNEETFALTASDGSYTMGSGGDFNTIWPSKITKARLSVTSASPSYELEMDILGLHEWAQIVQKNVSSNIPTSLYIDYSYPLAVLKLYPIPSYAQSIILNSEKLIASFATAATSVSLPPGWLRFLEYQLAVDLAPEYGQEPSPTIQRIALESKASLKRKYKPTPMMKSEVSALVNGKPFNWLQGE